MDLSAYVREEKMIVGERSIEAKRKTLHCFFLVQANANSGSKGAKKSLSRQLLAGRLSGFRRGGREEVQVQTSDSLLENQKKVHRLGQPTHECTWTQENLSAGPPWIPASTDRQ